MKQQVFGNWPEISRKLDPSDNEFGLGFVNLHGAFELTKVVLHIVKIKQQVL